MAELYISANSRNGKLITLPDIPEITLGRGSSNTVTLLDEGVSREHARIAKSGGNYIISDLNSRNGTRVNGTAIRQQVLHSGDEILIGRVALVFVNLDTSSTRNEREVSGSIVEDHLTTIELVLENREAELQWDSEEEDSEKINLASERGTEVLKIEGDEGRSFELMTFYDIVAHVNSLVDLPVMLDHVLERAMKLFGAGRGVVMLTKEDRHGDLETIAARSEECVPKQIEISDVIANSALQGKAVLSNAHECPSLPSENRGDSSDQKARVAMCVPVKSRDQVLGIIYLDSRPGSGKGFSEKGLSFLKAISNGCATAIENARLFQWNQRLRRRLESLINHAGDAIITVCAGLRVSSWNEASEDIFGYKRDEILGQSFQILFAEGDQDDMRLIRSQILSKLVLKNFETTMVRKDGKPIKVNLTMTENPGPEEKEEGGPSEFICIIRDVSLIHEFRKQLLLAEKFASIGRTVAGIAHHVNSPLGAIVGRTEVLLKGIDGIDPSLLRTQLLAIAEDSKRISSIISWLLNFSRPSDQSHDKVEVRSVLNDAIGALDPLVSKRKAEIVVGIKDQSEPILLLGRDSDLKQVFANILRNSLEAIEIGQKITISVHVREEGRKSRIGGDTRLVEVNVKDAGRGIPEDKLDYVWEPFFTTKKVGDGTGLGLFITRNIVEKQAGDIEIESEEGVGTTVSVILPIDG